MSPILLPVWNLALPEAVTVNAVMLATSITRDPSCPPTYTQVNPRARESQRAYSLHMKRTNVRPNE